MGNSILFTDIRKSVIDRVAECMYTYNMDMGMVDKAFVITYGEGTNINTDLDTREVEDIKEGISNTLIELRKKEFMQRSIELTNRIYLRNGEGNYYEIVYEGVKDFIGFVDVDKHKAVINITEIKIKAEELTALLIGIKEMFGDLNISFK